MPWGDRTGPMGMGPMTGRGLGVCAGFGGPGNSYAAPRRGFRGRGGGRGGRGFRNRYYATGMPGWQRGGPGWGGWGAWPAAPWGGPAPYGAYGAGPAADQGLEFLRGEAQRLEAMLADIHQRIDELTAEEKSRDE